MALAPGPVAVFRIVPPGDKVVLGETVRRAPRWSRAAWGLLLASLVASLLRQLGLGAFLRRSLLPKTGRIAT